MALAFGPNTSGPVSAEWLGRSWTTGETVRVTIAQNNNYLSTEEALALHAQLGVALEAAGCTPVEVTVSDESDEGSPA
jgi:hypothetical protein